MPWLNVANAIIPSATQRYQLATKQTPTPPSPCVFSLQYPVTLLEEKYTFLVDGKLETSESNSYAWLKWQAGLTRLKTFV